MELIFESPYMPFVIAFVVSAVSAYPIFRLLLAMKSRQTVSQFAPEGHRIKQGTPTMGGLIVVIGFLAVCGSGAMQYASAFGYAYRFGDSRSDFLVGTLFLGFALIGFVDDFVVPRMFVGKRGLGWKQKILMQFLFASVFAFEAYGSVSFHMLAAVFLILFFSNAFNFSDGLDALAALLLIGLVIGIAFIALYADEQRLWRYLLALLGGILPFLYLNRPKAKVFMGDVGSLPTGAVIGMVVAAIAFPYPPFKVTFLNGIEAHNQYGLQNASATTAKFLSLFIVSGMMIVELVPVPLQILSVKLRKKKLFSFTPIHHAFERKGWPEIKVVLVFATCQAVLSAIAVFVAHSAISPNPNLSLSGSLQTDIYSPRSSFCALLRPSAVNNPGNRNEPQKGAGKRRNDAAWVKPYPGGHV